MNGRSKALYFSVTVLVVLCTLAGLAGRARAVSLDSSGTGAPYFACTDYFSVKYAKYDPNFEIRLDGACTWGIGPKGETPTVEIITGEARKLIQFFGAYFPDTGTAVEAMMHQGLRWEWTYSCSENPWVHGTPCTGETPHIAFQSAGGGTSNVAIPAPYPYSMTRIGAGQRTWLQDLETSEEVTSGWDPFYQGPSSQQMQIEKPGFAEVVPENAASFQLALNSSSPVNPAANVSIRWERQEEAPEMVGDIVLPSGITHMWYPFNGPASFSWSAFPASMPVSGGVFAEPGLYRVMVKLAGDTGWTPWRSFWIGQPTVDVKALKETIQLTDQGSQSYAQGMQGMFRDWKTEAAKISPAAMPKAGFGKRAPAVKPLSGPAPSGPSTEPQGGGEMRPMSGKGPVKPGIARTEGAGALGKKKSPGQMTRLAKKRVSLGKPRLVVKQVSKTNNPKPGQNVDLKVTLENQGARANAEGQYVLKVKVLKEPETNACELQVQSVALPSVPAGETHEQKLPQVATLKAPGTYKLQVEAYAADIGSQSGTVEFTLKGQAIERMPPPDALPQLPRERSRERIRIPATRQAQ